MKERGIIMSAPMVRAILEGRKTQTRRMVTGRFELETFDSFAEGYETAREAFEIHSVRDIERRGDSKVTRYTGLLCSLAEYPEEGSVEIRCRYGVAGDRLWVRESFCITRWGVRRRGVTRIELQGYYIADETFFKIVLSSPESVKFARWKRKTGTFPAIFMFRSLGRICEPITKVRVERLQDISEEDAKAEGIELYQAARGIFSQHNDRLYARAYARLWDSLHGKGAWEKNPWVWVIESCRVKP